MSDKQWPGLAHLTHWGRVTHICISIRTNCGPDNGLLPGRCQAVIWKKTLNIVNWILRNKLQWNFLSKFKHFHSRKCTWKCRLRKGGNFASASMCSCSQCHNLTSIVNSLCFVLWQLCHYWRFNLSNKLVFGAISDISIMRPNRTKSIETYSFAPWQLHYTPAISIEWPLLFS